LQIPADRAHSQPQAEPFQVFWGGPDRPVRCLRELLEERIHAVPPGGEILWVTYYFRDEGLARALVQARCRGVKVRVVMEGNPRTGEVNNRVRQILDGPEGLGRGVRFLNHDISSKWPLRIFHADDKCRLHEKLYCFSHPEPCALVGSFNPSGNIPEEPAVILQIGDQDRGHNVLVEIRTQALVEGLRAHALRIFEKRHGPWERFLPESNKAIQAGKTRVLFFPRLRCQVFDALFAGLAAGSFLRMAVSHLNDRAVCKRLSALSRRGVHVEILAHDTQRRVPSWVEQQLLQSGIVFNRYIHPEGLPMHNKFMLFDTPGRRVLAFGSMNLSERSLHANHELLVFDETPGLYDLFRQRWDEMLLEVNDSQIMSNHQVPIP
jgi:hypothetical protein